MKMPDRVLCSSGRRQETSYPREVDASPDEGIESAQSIVY